VAGAHPVGKAEGVAGSSRQSTPQKQPLLGFHQLGGRRLAALDHEPVIDKNVV
jgi:hypothetical protein